MNFFRKIKSKFNSLSKTKKTIVSIVAIFLALLIIAVSAFLIIFKYNYNGLLGITNEELGVTEDNLPNGVTNIALFGVDSRSNKFKGNTDSIMILSIDTIHKKVKITSVMRDSLVKIEGYSPYKINSAYAKGGPKLAINTLNKNFGLNITEYATINFGGMSKMIDAVGGIDANITKAEMNDANIHIKYMAQELKVEPTYIKEYGSVHLNGLQATSFARIRHVATVNGVNNDYGRTDRQRYVMNQLFNKALSMSTMSLTKLVKTCIPFVETSLDYFQIIKLAGALKIDGVQFSQMRIPQNDYVINGGFGVHGGSTVYYNLDYAKDVLHAYIYDDVSYEDYKAKNGVNKKGWYKTDSFSNKEQIADSSSEVQQQNDVSSYYQMVASESGNTITSESSSSNYEFDLTSSNSTSSFVSSSDYASSEITSSDTNDANDNIDNLVSSNVSSTVSLN